MPLTRSDVDCGYLAYSRSYPAYVLCVIFTCDVYRIHALNEALALILAISLAEQAYNCHVRSCRVRHLTHALGVCLRLTGNTGDDSREVSPRQTGHILCTAVLPDPIFSFLPPSLTPNSHLHMVLPVPVREFLDTPGIVSDLFVRTVGGLMSDFVPEVRRPAVQGP